MFLSHIDVSFPLCSLPPLCLKIKKIFKKTKFYLWNILENSKNSIETKSRSVATQARGGRKGGREQQRVVLKLGNGTCIHCHCHCAEGFVDTHTREYLSDLKCMQFIVQLSFLNDAIFKKVHVGISGESPLLLVMSAICLERGGSPSWLLNQYWNQWGKLKVVILGLSPQKILFNWFVCDPGINVCYSLAGYSFFWGGGLIKIYWRT